MNELKELRQKYILLRRLTERDIERGWGHEAALLDHCQVLEMLNDLRESFDEIDHLRAENADVSRKYHEAMDIMSAWQNIDGAELAGRYVALRAQLATAVEALEFVTKGDIMKYGVSQWVADAQSKARAALERIKEGK